MQDPTRRDEPKSSPNDGLGGDRCCNLAYVAPLEARVVSLFVNIHIHKDACIRIVVGKECRAEARMKTENREKEDAGLMESLESRTVRGRDRERETHRKLYFKKCTHSMYICVCSMHTFIQVLTRTDRSTIVLQCS